MAAYIAASSYPTVKVMSPTSVLDVQMIGFYTQPTGIYCEYGVPHDAFVQEGTGASDQPLIQNLADAIEAVVSAVDCVYGGTFVQDTDPVTGLLVDYVQFALAHSNATTGLGPFTSFVDVPVNNFFTGQATGIGGLVIGQGSGADPVDQVATACDSLKALAGG